MPSYCVNSNAQTNGDHEVHDLSTCNRLPNVQNRVSLGSHTDCHGAVKAAKDKGYDTANGCYYCCEPCNTG